MISRLLIAILFISLVACSDSSDDQATPQQQIIAPETQDEFDMTLGAGTSKSWNASSFKLAGMDLDCRLDDTFTFFEDGTFEYNGGDVLCQLEDIQRIRTGTWTSDLDAGVIRFNFDGAEHTARYIKITDNEIQLEGSWGGMTIKATYLPTGS